MHVQIKQITGRGQLKRFIRLPSQIHRMHQRWIPPICADEWRFFNAKKNRAFSYCDTTLALAYRNNSLSGRIMGIVNRRSNELQNERTARFGYLECFEDKEVAHALLDYVENWARKKGMNKVIGPMGFADQDPKGFLVEGLENEPTIATYYNFEYIIRFLESKDYKKEVDYVMYKINVPEEIPELYARIYERLSRLPEFTLLEFTRRKALKPYIRPALSLMNETYQNLYGFVPLDEEEMINLAKRYLPVIDPRFLKVITKGNEIVGFVLGLPNMNEGLRKANGRLFPFGIFKIALAARRAKELDLLLGAVREGYRGRGLDVLMGTAIMRSAKKAGFEFMDSHQELETNISVRAEMERVGGQVYKRFRVFHKPL